MTSDEGSSRPRRTLDKGRMEGFSDGVLAFAITLLVVDIALRPPGSPTQQFFHAWPSYVAYLVSFFTIGAAWIAHHGLTDELDRVDPIFLRLNLLFLLAIAVLPFPTRLMVQGLEKERGLATASRCRLRHDTSGDSTFVDSVGRIRSEQKFAKTGYL